MFLLRKSKMNEAVQALQFYRNSRRMSDQKLDFYKNELDKLINTKDDSKSDANISWKDFRKFMIANKTELKLVLLIISNIS